MNHTIGQPTDITKIQQPTNMQAGDPIRFFPVDFRTKDPNLARWDDPKKYTYNNQSYYLPFEHTICLSDRWNWFQKKSIMPARTVDELEELFYWGTANKNILIINVPPDQHGLIRENEANRLFELADRLGIRNGKGKLPTRKENILFNKKAVCSDTSDRTKNPIAFINDYSLETYWKGVTQKPTIEIDLTKNKSFNNIVLMENPDFVDLKDGFSRIRNYRIKKYTIEAWINNQWKEIYAGDEMGATKKITFSSPIKTNKIRFQIKEASDVPMISHIAAY